MDKTIRIIKENKEDYQIYHNTYASAIQTSLVYAQDKGYSLNDDEIGTKIGTGPAKPKAGETNKITLTLYKDGKEQGKAFHIQVYNRGTSKNEYELNCYIM